MDLDRSVVSRRVLEVLASQPDHAASWEQLLRATGVSDVVLEDALLAIRSDIQVHPESAARKIDVVRLRRPATSTAAPQRSAEQRHAGSESWIGPLVAGCGTAAAAFVLTYVSGARLFVLFILLGAIAALLVRWFRESNFYRRMIVVAIATPSGTAGAVALSPSSGADTAKLEWQVLTGASVAGSVLLVVVFVAADVLLRR